MADIERITKRLEWTFAKTMKNIPHEYTVKRLYDKAKKMIMRRYSFIF